MIELPVYCINAWSWLCHKPALGYRRLRVRKHPPSSRHPALDLWACQGVTAGGSFWPGMLLLTHSTVTFPLLRPTVKHLCLMNLVKSYRAKAQRPLAPLLCRHSAQALIPRDVTVGLLLLPAVQVSSTNTHKDQQKDSHHQSPLEGFKTARG